MTSTPLKKVTDPQSSNSTESNEFPYEVSSGEQTTAHEWRLPLHEDSCEILAYTVETCLCLQCLLTGLVKSRMVNSQAGEDSWDFWGEAREGGI